MVLAATQLDTNLRRAKASIVIYTNSVGSSGWSTSIVFSTNKFYKNKYQYQEVGIPKESRPGTPTSDLESQFLKIVKLLFNSFYLFLLIALSISTTRRLTTSLVKAYSTIRNTRLSMFPLVLLTLKLFLFILHRKSVPCQPQLKAGGAWLER